MEYDADGLLQKDLRKAPGATNFRDGNVEGFKSREASELYCSNIFNYFKNQLFTKTRAEITFQVREILSKWSVRELLSYLNNQ